MITKEKGRGVALNGVSKHLQVLVGIPIRVVDDDCVCLSEVDAQPACPSREQEDEEVFAGLELIHGLLAVLPGDRAIQSAAFMPLLLQERVQDIQHFCHLNQKTGVSVEEHFETMTWA